MTQLFEDKERTVYIRAWDIENRYVRYDSCSSELSSQIRDTLNDWYKYYPDTEKSELKKRLQTSFSSAFYELFLHELFRRQGFVLEPHPILPNTTKRPDFLVCGHGLEFYLEAKESTDNNISYSRTKDGIFLNSIGPKFTRVSAILITNVREDNLDVAKHWFIQNPFARKNLPVDRFDLSKVIIENDQMQISNGKSIREILGLPIDWFKHP